MLAYSIIWTSRIVRDKLLTDSRNLPRCISPKWTVLEASWRKQWQMVSKMVEIQWSESEQPVSYRSTSQWATKMPQVCKIKRGSQQQLQVVSIRISSSHASRYTPASKITRRKSSGPRSPTSTNCSTSSRSSMKRLNRSERLTCSELISISNCSWKPIKLDMPRNKSLSNSIACKT